MLPRINRVRQEKDIKKLLRSRIRKNLGLVEIIVAKIGSQNSSKNIGQNTSQLAIQINSQAYNQNFYPKQTDLLESFQLVIIISKKIHKKATQRRLIKRRISFIFEDLKAKNRLPKNVQMAILVKEKGILQTKFSDLAELIKKGARDAYFFLNKPANKAINKNTKKPIRSPVKVTRQHGSINQNN